jgi:hypothetical protein
VRAGAEGVRAQEGKMINKSLLTLGLVINKLSEGAQLNGAAAASCSPALMPCLLAAA